MTAARKRGKRPDVPRPWCCPDRSCSPLHLLAGGKVDGSEPGESFLCFGKMEREIEFIYDGARHANDLSTCSYSAPKGLIRFHENADDWRMVKEAYTDALAALEEPK
jgi:hypothetical protein